MRGTDHILFAVNGFTCALPLDEIVHISSIVALDPMPGLPEAVIGTCIVHGRVVFGIDISIALGVERHAFNANARMLIVQHGTVLLGVLADTVGDIMPKSEALQEPSATGGTTALPLRMEAREWKRRLNSSGIVTDAIRDFFYVASTPVYVIDTWRALGTNDAEILSLLTGFMHSMQRTPTG